MNDNQSTMARELALKFLYQCESEKLYYYSESHFNSFISFQNPSDLAKERAKHLCRGVMEEKDDIDTLLNEVSSKWSTERMPVIDRSILRIAVYELTANKAPVKVILNEAINLAKTYGTENSGKFVNGVLDAASKKVRA